MRVICSHQGYGECLLFYLFICYSFGSAESLWPCVQHLLPLHYTAVPSVLANSRLSFNLCSNYSLPHTQWGRFSQDSAFSLVACNHNCSEKQPCTSVFIISSFTRFKSPVPWPCQFNLPPSLQGQAWYLVHSRVGFSVCLQNLWLTDI